MTFARKYLFPIWRHLDNLILIGFGGYFTYRGFTGMSAKELTPIMVGLLAGVALSQLRSRIQVSSVAATWHRARTDLLLRDFPPEYREAQSTVSHNYFFAGTTMARTLPIMATHITRVLKNGGRVRILLPNPDIAPLMDMIAASRPTTNAAAIQRSITHSLATAEDLKTQGTGTLEARTFNSLPSIGINAMDLEHPTASIMVQMYEYAPKKEGGPIFFLTGEDRMWFDHFEQQIERLWDDGRPYIPGR